MVVQTHRTEYFSTLQRWQPHKKKAKCFLINRECVTIINYALAQRLFLEIKMKKQNMARERERERIFHIGQYRTDSISSIA